MSKKALLPIAFEEFQNTILKLGLEKFRARQVWDWLFRKFVFDFSAMTDLPLVARKKLAEEFPTILPSEYAVQQAKDGTIKIAIPLADRKIVEAVALPDEKTLTFCLSSQIGCPVGCAFCRTGALGFVRNLTIDEIVLQTMLLIKISGSRPTNIVFMGMGEPFLNRSAVFGAIDLFCDHKQLGLATRRITISTAGVIDGIRELANRPGEVNLAISLHSVDEKVRSHLVPLNKCYPLNSLRSAIIEYLESTNRRVTFEITLLKGVNDSLADALNLAQFCEGMLCHINIVRFNPFPGSIYKPAPEIAEKEFRKALKKAGLPVTIRRSRGNDILAACGQLAGK